MKPFPNIILSPTTAHRIPSSPKAEHLINELLTYEVNAAAFLMDEDLLAAAEAKGFHNNLDRALNDLHSQLPPAVLRAKIKTYHGN